MISNGQKAAIHVAKNQLGLTEIEYRAELLKCVGVSSSLDLTKKTFLEAMRHFKSLGFVSSNKDYRVIDNLPEGDRRIMSKINAIRLDMKKSWNWVDGIAKQQAGIEKVMWVKGHPLFKVLQAMVIHQKKKKKKTEKEA
jgi:phage gp16-like protein